VLASCRVTVGLRGVFLWGGNAGQWQDCSAVETDMGMIFFAFERWIYDGGFCEREF